MRARKWNPLHPALGSEGHSLPADSICLSVCLSLRPTEECEPSLWGSWSPCTHNGKTCGSAWGLETRLREAGRAGQEEAATCQVLSESRKCPIRRPCPGGEHQAWHAGPRRGEPRGYCEWPGDTGLTKRRVGLPGSPSAAPSRGLSTAHPASLQRRLFLAGSAPSR